jgi:GTP cyclohydrolase I
VTTLDIVVSLCRHHVMLKLGTVEVSFGPITKVNLGLQSKLTVETRRT